MTQTRYQMDSCLGDVDAMVLALTDAVRAGLGDDPRMRFEICASELLTNCVKHAVPRSGGAKIDLTLEDSAQAVTLAVFDPLGAPPFDLRDRAVDLDAVDPLAEGGRGLGLILQCADAVDYGPVGNRNRVLLTFYKTETTPQTAPYGKHPD